MPAPVLTSESRTVAAVHMLLIHLLTPDMSYIGPYTERLHDIMTDFSYSLFAPGSYVFHTEFA